MDLTKFSFLKRRRDLTPEAFQKHWRGRHVEVLVDQGGHRDYNRRYVQNTVLRFFPSRAGEPRFDGVAQMTPHDARVLSQGLQADLRYARFVRPDEARFLEVDGCFFTYANSIELQAEPPGGSQGRIFVLYERIAERTAPSIGTMAEHARILCALSLECLAGATLHRFEAQSPRNMRDGGPLPSDDCFIGLAEFRVRTESEIVIARAVEAMLSSGPARLLRADGLTASVFSARAVVIY